MAALPLEARFGLTHTHGTDWHSTMSLISSEGQVLATSAQFDSPGMPHNKDGAENPVRLDYDFNFPAGLYDQIAIADELSAC